MNEYTDKILNEKLEAAKRKTFKGRTKQLKEGYQNLKKSGKEKYKLLQANKPLQVGLIGAGIVSCFAVLGVMYNSK